MSEADIQALLDELADRLGASVVLEDVALRLLSHTDHEGAIDDVRRASILGRHATDEVRAWFEQWEIRQRTDPVRTPAEPKLGILERWCVPVRFRETHLGYIWVLDEGRLAEADLGPAVATAEHIGAQLYLRRLAARADTDLLRLLLTPAPDSEIIAAARQFGFDMHKGPLAVVVTGPVNDAQLGPPVVRGLARAARRASDSASPQPILSGVFSNTAVLLAPLRRHDDLAPARHLADSVCTFAKQFVDEPLDLYAAIGGAVDLGRAGRSYAEARRALQTVRAVPALGPIVAWDDLGVFRALTLIPSDEIERGVLDPRVQRLLSDETLASTAETFLDNAGNIHDTASQLFLHRATLYQRLDRISAAYSLDLRRNGDHRLLTHLGLKLARLVHDA